MAPMFVRTARMNRRSLRLLVGAVVALLCAGMASSQQNPSSARPLAKPALSAGEIIARLQEKNHEREMALHKFQGTRIYSLRYSGFFGTHEAAAVITINYASPDDRQFTVVSQTGSKFLFDHVIKGLLDGEKEAASQQNRERNALSPENYDFALDDDATSADPSHYVLRVSPKTDFKYLYRGRIWIDAHDFAVTRIEAEPARTPSFWVKRSDVHHRYEKVDGFWLPAEDQTDSLIRMGGHALLSIEYKDYKILEAAPLDPSSNVIAGSETSGDAHHN